MLKALFAAFSIFTVTLFSDIGSRDDWYLIADDEAMADEDRTGSDPFDRGDGRLGFPAGPKGGDGEA